MASRWVDTPHHEVFGVVGELVGLDLATVADDAEACAATAVAQPAIFAASLAAHDALVAAGITPDIVAGHSLGELTASVAAGTLTREDGARLVGIRGRAFGEACTANPGTMAAVLRVELDELRPIVRGINDLVIANSNAPGQTVVAGSQAAIDELTAALADRRARVMSLDVEGAFHSPAMTTAVPALVDALADMTLADPRIPLVSGIDGTDRTNAADVRRALVDGVLSPVLWIDVQRRLAELVDVVIEVGPGAILAGCAKRTITDVPFVSVGGPDDVAAALELIDSLTSVPSVPAPVSTGASS